MEPSSITHLSHELLLAIVQDPCLDYDDILALRLTCSVLSDAAAAVLFHRIRISSLIRDRDAFLAICKAPHLAQCVREVEWQELSYFSSTFDALSQSPGVPGLAIDKDEAAFFATLESLVSDLFWLPKVPPVALAREFPVEEQRREIIAQFLPEFLAALKKLPNLHTLLSQPMPVDRVLHWCEYPISVEILHSQHPFVPQAAIKALIPQGNDGLFEFLFPALRSLPVTRLLWDEEHVGLRPLCPAVPAAFSRLESLSITVHPHLDRQYDELRANLDAATNVRHLGLALSWTPEASPHADSAQFALLRLSPELQSSWTGLHSLSLLSMPLATRALLPLVTANAKTLRHLYLHDCSLEFSHVAELAQVPDIRLESLGFAEQGIAVVTRVAEDVLGCFLTLEHEFQGDSKRRNNNIIVHTRAAAEKVGEPLYSYKIKNHRINGDPRLDEKAWRYYSDAEPDRVDDSDSDSGDSQDERLRNAPRWVWGRYSNEDRFGTVYCYQVPPDHPHCHPTEYWRFTYRDGSVSLGTDPCDWYEDWDPDAGDVEEPTPYCKELTWFYEEFQPRRIYNYLGVTMDALRQVKPPEGAIPYGREQDQEFKEVKYEHIRYY